MAKNELITTNKEGKKLLDEVMKDINKEVVDAKRNKIKNTLKQIRMAELTLTKLKSQLKDLLEGKELTEEEYLFGD